MGCSKQEQALLMARFERVLSDLSGKVGRPYFAEDGFILFRANSLELLPALQGAVSVDLTVTSPPYNIGKAYESAMRIEEYIEWSARWMAEVHAATSASGAMWLNLGYFEVPTKGLCVPISYLLWDKSPFYLVQEVVWNYGAGVSCKQRFSPRNEKWLFYAKDPARYVFNLDAVRDPNVKYPMQKKNGKLRCHPLGKNPSDVWCIPKVTSGANRSSRERTDHPAQFPLRVVDRIIRASSNPGGIVLDPFSGSGSAGLAAIGTARVFVGIESREDYCRIAVERFRRFRERSESKQAQLFG